MALRIDVALYDRGLVGEAFSYTTPDSDTSLVGSVIIVPVGKHQHRAVVLASSALTEEKQLIHIQQPEIVLPNLLTEVQCELVLYMAKTYFSPMHKVLRLFVPEKVWNGTYAPKREIYVSLADTGAYELTARMKTMILLESYLKDKRQVAKDEVRKEFSLQVYNKAKAIGMLTEREGKILTSQEHADGVPPRTLTKEQHALFDKVLSAPQNAYLLHGVTGAGKTEIYLHLALHYAKMGKQTLLIVPEIVLTPQLRAYFARIFGSAVSIFHSKLSETEKLQEWYRVKEGESTIILGSRSAFFAPFQDLGLIIVDEEHEWTYKNEQNPRYYIHTIAYELHAILNRYKKTCTLLFGSATPRVETYAKTFDTEHPLHLLSLTQRIFEQTSNSLDK